jgi:cation:H+ antiporter
LLVGAEVLVRYASRLAALAGISSLVIGLTVVAFGTSSPELAVSVSSAWRGQGDIAVGNAVGSNIFNILCILGLSAAIAPLIVSRQLIRIDVPVMIGTAALMYAAAWDGTLSRTEGLIAIVLLVLYTIFIMREGKEELKTEEDLPGVPPPKTRAGIAFAVGGVLVGLAMLVLGANWLVEGAVTLARTLGVSELVIGLTIVAAGTSMPEIATSVMASIRGERDIAVGNVVGSNIFNMLCVLGVTAAVAPAPVPVAESALRFDVPVMLFACIACMPIFISGTIVSRIDGVLLLSYYFIYTAVLYLKATGSTWLPYDGLLALYLSVPAISVIMIDSLVRSSRTLRSLEKALFDQIDGAVLAAAAQARKIVIAVTGFTVLGVGVIMLVTPGPAFVIIPIGLGILATEFVWARRLLQRFRKQLEDGARQLGLMKPENTESSPPAAAPPTGHPDNLQEPR